MTDPIPGLSKADEAAQSSTVRAQDAVPPYGEHIGDDIYLEAPPAISGLIPHFPGPDAPEENNENESAYAPALSDLGPLPAPEPSVAGPLSLTIDKALIFPNTIPSNALYSLNYTLNSMGSSITLRRSVPGIIREDGRKGKIVDKDLYEITRPPFNLLGFDIVGKRKSTFPGTGELQLKSGASGLGRKFWECRFKGRAVLVGKKGVWTDGEGKIVAREVNEVVPKKGRGKGKEKEVDEGVRENPSLNFEDREGGINELSLDLMVAVWCAKTWWAETFEAKSARDGTSEGAFSNHSRRVPANEVVASQHLRSNHVLGRNAKLWT